LEATWPESVHRRASGGSIGRSSIGKPSGWPRVRARKRFARWARLAWQVSGGWIGVADRLLEKGGREDGIEVGSYDTPMDWLRGNIVACLPPGAPHPECGMELLVSASPGLSHLLLPHSSLCDFAPSRPCVPFFSSALNTRTKRGDSPRVFSNTFLNFQGLQPTTTAIGQA
jgi:hypothetical protein